MRQALTASPGTADAGRAPAESLREQQLRNHQELERVRAALQAREAELGARHGQLEEREATRAALASHVVHDLKNQIAVIKANLSYLLEEGVGSAGRDHAEVAARHIDRVLALVLGLHDP